MDHLRAQSALAVAAAGRQPVGATLVQSGADMVFGFELNHHLGEGLYHLLQPTFVQLQLDLAQVFNPGPSSLID